MQFTDFVKLCCEFYTTVENSQTGIVGMLWTELQIISARVSFFINSTGITHEEVPKYQTVFLLKLTTKTDSSQIWLGLLDTFRTRTRDFKSGHCPVPLPVQGLTALRVIDIRYTARGARHLLVYVKLSAVSIYIATLNSYHTAAVSKLASNWQ
jgi:hypothetical protein